MGRNAGDINKTIKWRLNITLGDKVILNGEYPSLNDIADLLDMSYNKCYEMSSKGRSKKIKNNSPYITNIDIIKI